MLYSTNSAIKTSTLNHSEFLQLPPSGSCEVAVGSGAGGGRVENATEGGLVADGFGGHFELSFRIGSHPDEELWLQFCDEGLDVGLAGFFDWNEGAGGEFVGGEVGSGIFHPDQRAVVGDEVVGEEALCGGEFFCEEAPETFAGYFGAGAVESGDGSFGVLALGLAHWAGDFEPIADVIDFAKGNACLRHPVRTGIHTHEEDAFGAAPIFLQILGMGLPSIFEGIVGMGDGFRKGEPVQVCA